MSRLRRLGKIVRVCCRYRLDTLIDTDALPRRHAWLLRLAPWRLIAAGPRSRGERLRLALQALGPISIKFGQLLSTRRDLLPTDIADELAKLQDEVAPFAPARARAIIEQALAAPVAELFVSFDEEPLASASVAQVHAATLHSGQQVVVKVLRPGIEAVIRQDIALLFTLARLLARYSADGRRLHPVEVVSDYQTTILDELDLRREAANTSQLRRNFAAGTRVYVPEVFWDYSRRNIFVMERIHGIPVTDLATLKARGTDLKLLAERGVEIFFTQVFRDSFFHADMHPGNIFVADGDPADPHYIAIDCAIIGSLSDFDQYYLARNLLAIFRRDYRACAQLHLECGWVPPGTPPHEFEAALRAVCEPVFEKPIGEISFAQLLINLFQTARRFDMELQPSLVLLQKTLLNIEGLGRQIYPQLDLWDTALPFLEEWIQARYSPQGIAGRLRDKLPSWLEQLPQLPDALLGHAQQARQLDSIAQRQQRQLDKLQRQLRSARAQRKRLLLSLLLCSSAVVIALPDSLTRLAQAPPLSWGLLALGLYLLWPRQ